MAVGPLSISDLADGMLRFAIHVLGPENVLYSYLFQHICEKIHRKDHRLQPSFTVA